MGLRYARAVSEHETVTWCAWEHTSTTVTKRCDWEHITVGALRNLYIIYHVDMIFVAEKEKRYE